MWKVVAIWALSAGVLAAPPQRVSMVGMPESDPEIRKVAEAYRQAVLSGNAAQVATTYSDDAVEMPPGRPVLRGRAAIEGYYAELFRSPARITTFVLTPRETVVAGAVAYDAGSFRQERTGPAPAPITTTGSYLVVLKKERGVWKVVDSIYNLDAPCLQPSAGPGSPAAVDRTRSS